MSSLILRELENNDEQSFLRGVEYWRGEEIDWYTFDWKEGMSHADHLERLRKNKLGLDLKAGIVPSSMLYALVGSEIVGRMNIRHELNDYLARRGGHIGYAVAPKFRGNGYATEIMKQTFPVLQSLGLEKILVTCSDSNTPSWKIIERFSGVLESKLFDENSKEIIRRYWMKVL
jgi:predicted acetyltransferase